MDQNNDLDLSQNSLLNRLQDYSRKKCIKKKSFEFKIWPHEKVCQWISKQDYLKETIHETFEKWEKAHSDNHFPLNGPHYWSTVWDKDKIVGVYYCCEANLSDVFIEGEKGLYDGFLVILPELRGYGLGRRLDEYKNFWTSQELHWQHNWTFALPSLVEFNLKLGYTEYDEQAFERGEYTTLWRVLESPQQFNSFD